MWRNTRRRRLHPLDARAQRRPRLRARCAGFYGLDLYNLERLDAGGDRLPRRARTRSSRGSRTAATAASSRGPRTRRSTAAFAARGLCALRGRRDPDAARTCCRGRSIASRPECDDWLDAAANARLVKDAEAYYRVMYHGSAESWNLRDTHMFDTLNMILDAKGPNSKAIVWAHNSHIGNAAFTDMGMQPRRAEHRPAGQGEVGREGAADRLRHAYAAPSRRPTTGTSR